MVWSPAPMLKQMMSAPALPFALVIAARNVPTPALFALVTLNTAA